jgi:hypothetical protein
VVVLAGDFLNNLLPSPRSTTRLVRLSGHGAGFHTSEVRPNPDDLGTSHRGGVCGQQPSPEFLDALVEHEAQFRKEPPNFRLIVRGESLGGQDRNLFLETHSEKDLQSALIYLRSLFPNCRYPVSLYSGGLDAGSWDGERIAGRSWGLNVDVTRQR